MPAHNDAVAGINTVEACVELVDLFAEGSVNLVIADFGNILLMPKLQAKLKVFKGKVSFFYLVFIIILFEKFLYRIFITKRKQSYRYTMCCCCLLYG